MGNMVYAYVTHPDTAPDIRKPPTFDPQFGFASPRCPRTIRATREELDRANIPLDRRDYCVDYFMTWMRCREKNFPFANKCSHEYHHYDECEYHDFIIRMKEYEREKRLKERMKRILRRRHREQFGDDCIPPPPPKEC